MDWNAAKYLTYADERGRPYLDLVARIQTEAPRRVVDVGCGPANLTAVLAQRWPDAVVEGIDSSPDMVAAAAAVPGVAVRQGDAAEFRPPPDCDVLVSNATLQWVPAHLDVLRGWTEALGSGAWLAWQVPANFDMPSHAIMREMAAEPRWSTALTGVLRHHDAVAPPEDYLRLLSTAGCSADVWQTTYLHVLRGEDPVLEWVRGTGLRPILQALAAADAVEFEQDYAARLRVAYPRQADGTTILPFLRTFAVGRKR